MRLSIEPNTRQLSAFHSTIGIDGQEPVLPQLPSLDFSEKEISVPAKSAVTEINSNCDHHTQQPSSHTRKSSAPPIPRRSSRRKSGLYKSTRHRSLNKNSQHRISKEPIVQVPIETGEQTQTSSPAKPNKINDDIAKTFQAMEKLKPGSTQTLIVEKKRRLKSGAFLKVKRVLQGSLRRHKNDNSQECSSIDPRLIQSPPIQEHVLGYSKALGDTDLRLNEVRNLDENSKLRGLSSNFKIPRKPLNYDGMSFHSQQSALTDPFTETHTSGGQLMPLLPFGGPPLGPSTLDFLSGSNKKGSVHQNNKGFDDLDSLLTSSPLAQSTPRLRLEVNHTDPDRSRRMQKVDAGSPSVLDHNTFAEDSEVYQGMIAISPLRAKPQNQSEHLRSLVQATVQQVGLLKEKTVNNFAAAVTAVQTLSGSTSDSGFAPLNRKLKKHPSPSKDYLERLSRRLPDFPDPEPLPHHTHKHKDSSDIHKANFTLREKRKQDYQEENKELLSDLLISDDEFEECNSSIPVVAQSLETFGVEDLEVGTSVQLGKIMDQDDSMMELDELQSAPPSAPIYHENDCDEDLISFL
ncbi:hypothetical protein DSL72_002090 [Monilinia vaccinii-corymbosi]|uniref:Uncharacterized protein n=1 Tax=Monilinia vaccinii-corymbosi TaxID=61207 RepID=A0A8A3PBM7_9HELO|nr:hypothetical protein DSL72_002090 [Monilinia vaccinii-corymbosi]